MATALSDLTPFVQAEIPAVPDVIAQQYIVRASREFCRRARCYTQDVILSFVRQQSDYNLLTDTVLEGATTVGLSNVELVGVRSNVYKDGSQLQPTTPQQLTNDLGQWRYKDGTPLYYYMQEDNANMTVVYRPTVTDVRDVEAVTLSGTDPVVVTLSTETIGSTTSHFYAQGDWVTFYGVTGTTELNGNRYQISAATNNFITLADTNSSNFSAWISAGTCHRETVFIEVLAQPTLAATTLPAQLTDRYGEGLISGALMLLYGTPGKDWTNADLMIYHKAQFENWLEAANTQAQDRHSKRVPRAVKYGGIGGSALRETRYVGS